MKKVILSVLFLVLVISFAYAVPPVMVTNHNGSEIANLRQVVTEDVYSEDGVTTDISVLTDRTAYTAPFSLSRGEYFSISYLAKSNITEYAGTPNATIIMEQSWQLPQSVPLANSSNYTDTLNWTTPTGVANITDSITGDQLVIKSLSPVVLPWARLKINGSSANSMNTTIRIRLHKQVNF